ncbi:MAG: recombinase zinc beta ribbon domain-containing protein, partial [Alphaproteobacteria bacterium]|nr:recombinase zinc beta ribbon domain-containing protein [Alphaproteobacteria bacterium]
LIHAFSRFYRNGAEMELTIRSLRKLGVEVVSVTQPTGDDPAQEMMRQIIGIFDEYTSRENGKNVTRAMRESARQGFWNGATPPLGYRVVEAERRGVKIKKRLEVDPVEAETVRLIHRLYLEGEGERGPLGVKDLTSWLNRNGHRTRRGSPFGVASVHHILTNECYATGKWRYGVRNARTGTLHDPSTIVEIDIPTILPLDQFERVRQRLARNNPRVTPPRVVNGPTLLTGLAVCACCGHGMTRTGTQRRGRAYTYYSCSSSHRKGKSVCKGRHIPVGKLDALVVENVKEHLFGADRLARVLEALIERQGSQDRAVQERRASLEGELGNLRQKLSRLYRAIEDGFAELDDDLGERIQTLKHERQVAEDALSRLAAQVQAKAMLTPALLDRFSQLVREKLETGDIQARKAYLQTVLDQVEVGDDRIRVLADKAALAAAAMASGQGAPKVRGFERKWRARRDSNS